MSHKSQIVRIDGQSFTISDLTEFGFTAPAGFPAESNHGDLVFGADEIDVDFYVRHKNGPLVYCYFLNMSPGNRERIRHLLSQSAPQKTAQPVTTPASAPVSIAPSVAVKRETTHASPDKSGSPQVAPTTPPAPSSTSVEQPLLSSRPVQVSSGVSETVSGSSRTVSKNSSTLKRALFVLPLILGAGFLVGKFWPSGSGATNRVAISPSVQGTITQVLVDQGDKVKEGDILLQLGQQPPESQVSELANQLELSQAQLEAAEKSLAVHREKMEIITAKRVMELRAAQTEVEVLAKAKTESQKTVDRIRPYRESGAVSQVEFERIEMDFIQANARWIEKTNLVEQIQFAIKAADSKILVEAKEVSDKLAQLEIKYELAQAKHAQLEKQANSQRTGKTLNVCAPCDGEVFKIEYQVGDFVKSDAQMLYLKQSR